MSAAGLVASTVRAGAANSSRGGLYCHPMTAAQLAPEDDAALVAAVAGGGEAASQAERAFCERWRGRVFRYAAHHLRDGQLAADVAHETLVAVLAAMREGRVERADCLGSFVLSTCRHLVWEENRREGRRRRAAEAVAAASAVEAMLQDTGPSAASVDGAQLAGCIGHLASRERSVVLLTYVEDWPAARIAETLQTSPGNVRVIRHRALRRLLQCLDGAGDAPQAPSGRRVAP